MRAQGVRSIAIEEVRNYGKIVYIKNIFKNGWWRMHTPHPTTWIRPWPYATETIKRVYSHLAPLGLFFFTKKRSQKGEHWPNGSPSKYN